MSHRVVCVGAGNMAEALVRGWLAQGVFRAHELCVTDPEPGRRDYFAGQFGVAAQADNRAAVAEASMVILAIKPQVLAEAVGAFRDVLPPPACVISIAAGIRTATIEALLHEGQPVVRVMPNTPALIGRGVSALCGGAHAEEAHLAEAERMLKAVGITVRVAETEMDAVTAVSGSGPAYVFGFTEGLIAAAERAGLAPEIASRLAIETVTGAAALMRETGEPPDVLRARVTSRGGTTAAALASFEQDGWAGIIERAVAAAKRRSEALSGG